MGEVIVWLRRTHEVCYFPSRVSLLQAAKSQGRLDTIEAPEFIKKIEV